MRQRLKGSKINKWALSILGGETSLLAVIWHDIITMYMCGIHDASLLISNWLTVGLLSCGDFHLWSWIPWLWWQRLPCKEKGKLYYSTTNIPPLSLPASKDKKGNNWIGFIIAQRETSEIPCRSLVNRPFQSYLVPLFQNESSLKLHMWKWVWFAWKLSVGETHFLKNGVLRGLVLTHKQKTTRKWPIKISVKDVMLHCLDETL